MAQKNDTFSLFSLKKMVSDGHFLLVTVIILKGKHSTEGTKLFEGIQMFGVGHSPCRRADLPSCDLLSGAAIYVAPGIFRASSLFLSITFLHFVGKELIILQRKHH